MLDDAIRHAVSMAQARAAIAVMAARSDKGEPLTPAQLKAHWVVAHDRILAGYQPWLAECMAVATK